VVEDNTLNQLVAEATLTRMGYEVHSVANGAEALEAIAAMSYSVILMDCHMPVMDGFEATRRIRSDRRARVSGTPIVALTADALDGDRERCLEAGMDDYMTKPVSAAQLAAAVKRWAGSVSAPR